MIDFINEAFQWVNLPATCLLLVCLLYWTLVMIGAIGVDAFDLDFDADADIGDVDGDFDSNAGGFSSVAEFLHLQEVPIVIVGSVFALLFWAASFFGNHLLNPTHNRIIGLGVLSVNVPICLLLTRAMIGPFADGFKPQEVDKVREQMIGLVGEVTTSEVTPEFGQVSIKLNGPELVINARSESASQTLRKGDAAKILAYDYEKDTYTVQRSTWDEA